MSQAEPSSKPSPAPPSHTRRRLKLRDVLFLLLLFSGIIPLLISSSLLIRTTRDQFKDKERVLLTRSATAFADSLSEDLAQRKNHLRQLGQSLLAVPGFASLEERFREEWVRRHLDSFARDHPEIIDFNVVDQRGVGLRSQRPLSTPINQAMSEAMDQAARTQAAVYRFVIVSHRQDPGVVITVPVASAEESETLSAKGETLIVQVLVRPPSLRISAADSQEDIEQEGIEVEELFLIDADGRLLWSPGSRPEIELALLKSDLVGDLAGTSMSVSVTREYDLEVGNKVFPTLARIVPVEETGWSVVAHKPAEVAFQEVTRMVKTIAMSALFLVILALIFGLVAARLFSQPIQSLVQASHEIAAGNFDRRVRVTGLVGVELANLADDFNRMSEYVENYIEQLRKAAEANRELFISSIRAFAATIDAKDPYTRGHSERVATYSRAIARFLGLPKDVQERVWIAAVLHDVGKIGVDDRILKKGGVLTPEEFEQMKLHPVIGADIVGPISALREMIPGIRGHHEAWNGTGYPDKLKGEQIPLIARIIGVADTFDAITTTRPYQNAYSTDYALQTIKKLTGTKFDAKIVTAFLLAWEAGHIKKEQADNTTSKVRVPTAELIVAN